MHGHAADGWRSVERWAHTTSWQVGGGGGALAHALFDMGNGAERCAPRGVQRWSAS